MSPEQRIDNIRQFVFLRPYLRDVKFDVRMKGDDPVIEFKKLTFTQMAKLKHELREYDMEHIQVNPKKLINNKKKRKT